MAGLHKQIARGAIALACNLALQDCIDLIKATDKVSEDVARKQAIACAGAWCDPDAFRRVRCDSRAAGGMFVPEIELIWRLFRSLIQVVRWNRLLLLSRGGAAW